MNGIDRGFKSLVSPLTLADNYRGWERFPQWTVLSPRAELRNSSAPKGDIIDGRDELRCRYRRPIDGPCECDMLMVDFSESQPACSAGWWSAAAVLGRCAK